MAETTMRAGSPDVIDYTPTGGALNSGDVVVLSNTTGGPNLGIVQASSIPNNTKGSLVIRGSHHECINLNNAANYATVYWDNSAKKVTTVSTNNAKFGQVSRDGGGGANTNCFVYLNPFRGASE